MTSDHIEEVLEKVDAQADAGQLKVEIDVDPSSDLFESLKSSVADIVKDALAAEFESIQQKLSNSASGVVEEIKAQEEEEGVRTTIGEPTEAELAQIIKLTGVPSEASDWVTAGVHASNSILDRSGRRWGVKTLGLMGMDFIGKGFIIDHRWDSAEACRGTVIGAALVKEDSSIVPKEMLSGAGAEEFNKEIIDKEGFHWLHLTIAIPRNTEAAEMLSTRKYQSVSTGSILHSPYLRCPNCERSSNGQEVRMDTYTVDPKTRERVYDCPHLAGSPFLRQLIGSEEYDQMGFSDYVILDCESTSAVELSACQAGCLPRAQILRG